MDLAGAMVAHSEEPLQGLIGCNYVPFLPIWTEDVFAKCCVVVLLCWYVVEADLVELQFVDGGVSIAFPLS